MAFIWPLMKLLMAKFGLLNFLELATLFFTVSQSSGQSLQNETDDAFFHTVSKHWAPTASHIVSSPGFGPSYKSLTNLIVKRSIKFYLDLH